MSPPKQPSRELCQRSPLSQEKLREVAGRSCEASSNSHLFGLRSLDPSHHWPSHNLHLIFLTMGNITHPRNSLLSKKFLEASRRSSVAAKNSNKRPTSSPPSGHPRPPPARSTIPPHSPQHLEQSTTEIGSLREPTLAERPSPPTLLPPIDLTRHRK